MTSDNGDSTALGVQKKFLAISMVWLCVVLSGCTEFFNQNTSREGYIVYQSVPLQPAQNGIQGSLQILQDKRITIEQRKAWGFSDLPENKLSLQNGHLCLVDINGHTVFDETLNAPLGKVEKEFLYGTDFPTYFVSVDLGTGFGSYAGPATMLVEVHNGKLLHIQATEADLGVQKDIWLGKSLKNAWRIVPASDGKRKEIQLVQCHPNFKNPIWAGKDEFVIVYSTYRFQHGKWYRFSREKTGFWEDEGDWPKASEFP